MDFITQKYDRLPSFKPSEWATKTNMVIEKGPHGTAQQVVLLLGGSVRT